MADWRERRVPQFQQYMRNLLGREPTEREYAAAIMQLEQRGAGSIAVGHAFRNRLAAEGGDPERHLRHYDPLVLRQKNDDTKGPRWHELTPQSIDKWAAEYDRIASGSGPLQAGQTHFFSPAGMQAYYNKDPSMVRSAVRMTVPGYGEVLVPNWATRAVADGNFTNVNGEWFLTPNERYGKEPAPVRVASQDAEAQPGGFYGNPVPASPPPASAPATYAVASSAPDASTAVPKPNASESMLGGDAASKAIRIASLFSPRSSPQKEDEGIKFEPLRHDHRPLGDASGGLEMAAAAVPYLKRADGGSVDDTGITVPETPESLLAQQRQLIEGRRIAQMFPAGTEELPLPPGMERVETPRGVFHFDPMRISAREVVEASNARRENEVLGLGPMSKDDVARVMQQTGERPVSIVERDQMGNEVRGSLATPSTVGMQADTILRTADPKNIVDVEPVDNVIAQRTMRSYGGGIGTPRANEYAAGGGIGGKPFTGPLYGATGGRADKLPGTARSGSHVIPADIVSHMGQGNTNAGLKIMDRMFGTGPYGMSLSRRRRADGGAVEQEIPVALSDGEYVIEPEIVASLGNGDLDVGHDILDAWIMQERQNAINTLASLPPPATD